MIRGPTRVTAFVLATLVVLVAFAGCEGGSAGDSDGAVDAVEASASDQRDAGDADASDLGDGRDAGPIACRLDRGCPAGSRCATRRVHEVELEAGDDGRCVNEDDLIGRAPATWRWQSGGRALAERLCIAGGLSRGAGAGADRMRARQMELVLATGVQLLRLDLPWSEVEPERGARDFTGLDPMVDAARAEGVEVLGILAYSVPWASSDPDADRFYPPDDPADFAAYAAATAEHFRGRVFSYEVWNEPNAGYRFWRPTLHGDATAFGTLLVAAVDGVHASCPGCNVVGGGFFFHEMLINGALEFVHDMLEARPDVLAGLDAVSFHPYPRYPPRVAPETNTNGERAMGGMHADLEEVLALHGVVDASFAMTEIGWPSFGDVDEATQAAYLTRSLLLGAALGLDPLCWFNLVDGPNFGRFPPEDDFGLYRFGSEDPSGAIDAKPARDALAWLARIGDRATPAGAATDASLHAPAEGRFALHFDGPEGRWTALWKSDGRSEEVRLVGEAREAFDSFGRSIARTDGDAITFVLGATPVFLLPPSTVLRR